MMLSSFLLPGPPDRVVAAMLDEPKDDWSDTLPLELFLKGHCPLHACRCRSGTKHQREYQLHEHAYIVGFRKTFGPGASFPCDFRRPPAVAVGSMADGHVFYWKLDMNGFTFRSGRITDLDLWNDYAAVDPWRFPFV